MSRYVEEQECTEKCRSRQHGDAICAALTKRSVSDSDLCAYLYHTCCCCESVKDCSGRSSLHVAASCGRVNVVKWLLKYKHACVNAKDLESGYTALHRSVFYGKLNVAVCLMKMGASTSLTDANGLTMTEHAMKDRKSHCRAVDGEIYVWGSNANYTLGPQRARSAPELMDIFHKEHPQLSVRQICLDKFHCAIVATDGKVFTCGHGQGGRLGLPNEHSVLDPKMVQFSANGHGKSVVCLHASIGRDHSIFLTDTGHIWTCGLNTYRVLGFQPPPAQLLTPKPLNLLQHSVKEVCAARYHSLAWGYDCLYTWGLHVGQLGHDKTVQKYIISPKLVSNIFGAGAELIAVAASNGATAVATSKGDVYVLHEYQRRRIASRILNIVAISIIGGELDTSVDNSLSGEKCFELKVAAITDTGNLLLWQQSDPQLCRCIFSLNRLIKVKQASLNVNGVVFVTDEGEAFQASVRQRKKKTLISGNGVEKSAFHKYLEKDDCLQLKATKFPNIHRAITIQSDLKGGNFAVLQSSPRYSLTGIPDVSPSTMAEDFQNFLCDSNELDQIHDVVFKVSGETFSAHRYVLASNSAKFEKILMENAADELVVVKDVEPEIFEQLLSYVYCRKCDLMRSGPCPAQFLKFLSSDNDPDRKLTRKTELDQLTVMVDDEISAFEHYKKEKCKTVTTVWEPKRDPVRMLQEAARKYSLTSLQKLLDAYCCEGGRIVHRKPKTPETKVDNNSVVFDRALFPEYYDLVIKTKNGKELKAHKCVLAARLEYFNSMFSTRWNETNSCDSVSLPFNQAVVDLLLEFLYTDRVPRMENEEPETICSLLILADEFFVARLKEICEYVLSTLLTLKNVTQFASFAHLYNAQQLKNCCMEFICLNLPTVLESQALNGLEEEILDELTDFYCKWNPIMSQRVITPYATAPSDEIVASFGGSAPEERESGGESKATPKTSRRKHRGHRNGAEKPANFEEKSETPNTGGVLRENQPPKTISNSNKAEDGIPIRLKAITAARNILQTEPLSYNYSKLTRSSDSTSDLDDCALFGSSFEDFPELNSPPSPWTGVFSSCSRLLHKPERLDKTRIVRMSQKQRKRLSSESLSAKEFANSDSNNERVIPEAPKNPWKACPLISSPVGSPESAISAIITEERRQKENFTKMKSKLLLHTQMEDKAIEDLTKFYNCESVFDEIVCVERVEIGAVASPVWVQKGAFS